MRSEVLTAVLMKIPVMCDGRPCPRPECIYN